jgi:alkylhydroperoxidase family enzyme
MARLSYVDPAHAAPPVREALDRLPPLNVFRLVAHAETAFRPWLRLGQALLATTSLDPVLRELAILRVAALTKGGEYERIQHEDIAAAVGATPAQIAGARTGEGLEGDDELVVRFTSELLGDGEPAERTFTEAHERFGDRGVVELVLVIGHYQGLARLFATAQVDLDEAAGRAVADSAGGER